jgi:hypothetical protein
MWREDTVRGFAQICVPWSVREEMVRHRCCYKYDVRPPSLLLSLSTSLDLPCCRPIPDSSPSVGRVLLPRNGDPAGQMNCVTMYRFVGPLVFARLRGPCAMTSSIPSCLLKVFFPHLVLLGYYTPMLIPKQPSRVSRVLRVEDCPPFEEPHYPDEYPLSTLLQPSVFSGAVRPATYTTTRSSFVATRHLATFVPHQLFALPGVSSYFSCLCFHASYYDEVINVL